MDEAVHADLIPALKKLLSLRDVNMSKQCHTIEEC